jgi:hypothetical protein
VVQADFGSTINFDRTVLARSDYRFSHGLSTVPSVAQLSLATGAGEKLRLAMVIGLRHDLKT